MTIFDRPPAKVPGSALRPLAWLAAGAIIGVGAALLLPEAKRAHLRARLFAGLATKKAGKPLVPVSLTDVERYAPDSVAAGMEAHRAALELAGEASNGVVR